MNEKNDNIQILVDAWEQRPRRQLDYSGLTESSMADLEWTNNVIKSLIKAVPDIREKFGVHPTAEIVMPFTITQPIAAPQDVLETILTPSEGSGQPTESENASTDGDEAVKTVPVYDGGLGKMVMEVVPTPAAQVPVAGSDAPSKKALKVKGKERSTGNRLKKPKAVRTSAAKDRKSHTGGTSASEPAKPIEELPVSPPVAPSSGPTEVLASNPQPEPPAPKLMSIG